MTIGAAQQFFLGASKATGGGAAGYQIERSLRFSSNDSAFCARTPAVAGNRRTFTWAGWLKRSSLATADHYIFGAYGTKFEVLRFEPSTDKLQFLLNGGSAANLATTQVFRDFSAWYHIVVACDTTIASPSSDRIKIYVNGAQITSFSTATYPAQNYDSDYNNTVDHQLGALLTSGFYNGYMADIHFIDGQALTPSSFTEVSATTGQLVPKAYTGTFGTNGFWLKFSDNSAATAATLGNDYSGNNNDWTPNNLSVTAGSGNDSLVDTPTSYGTDTYVGGEVRGNYATWNPLNKGSNLTISNGNLDLTGSTGHATVLTTIPVVAGMKSYMEFTVTSTTGGGWGVTTNSAAENSYGELAGKWWGYDNGGSFNIINQTTVNGYSPRISNGNILQIAIDYATGKVHLGINNSWINSTNGTDGNPATGANPTFTLSTTSPIFPILESNGLFVACNFGQRPFAYTAPSGFKALCDTNLPAPVVAKPNTVMDVKLYTGNGSTQTISGLGFSPDFVWLKNRSAGDYHRLNDIIRGANRHLFSNTTDAEVVNDANGYLSAFTSDGFSLTSGTGVNASGNAYVAWTWDAGSSTVTNTQGSITSSVRANASAGFSVVTWTSDGASSVQTMGHGLGVTPGLIIAKNRSISGNWWVWHNTFSNQVRDYLLLQATDAKVTAGVDVWSTSSTTFGMRQATIANNTNLCVAYCFAPVAGYTSAGSYTGNGSADGPFVYTSMRPRWILLKRTDSTGNWTILDTARAGYNVDNNPLFPNLSDAEGTADLADILSNGFKLRSTDASVNASGGTYIYYAISETAFQYSRAR